MKHFLLIFCSALLCLTFAACGSTSEPQPSNDTGLQDADSPSETDLQAEPEETDISNNLKGEGSVDAPAVEGTLIETDYGSYVLPDGWYEFDQISTPEKPFYLKEGVSTESVISNISVECGDSKYAKDDHLEFRTALVQQLGTQASAVGMQMTAGGSYTEAGDVLYIFTISNDASSTVQYYVIGDYRYVLIHVTDLMDERIPDVNTIAAAIADSFTWA